MKWRDAFAELMGRLLATGDPFLVLRERTAAVDQLVRTAYRDHLAGYFADGVLPSSAGGLALVAVGGYGRRQLYPCSDIDLLLLLEKEPPGGAQKEAISAFLQALWDAGLRLSQSVRKPQDCCTLHDQNIELNISLLDQRFLIGDESLYQRMASGLVRFEFGRRQELTRRLCQLARSRHAKYQNTLYHLEPNIKEHPGGLRDLQVPRWLSRLRNALPDARGEPDEFRELAEAERFLGRTRCFLHAQTGRDSNVLTFDFQELLAEEAFPDKATVAQRMRDYYRHARDILRLTLRWIDSYEERSSSLLSQFRGWRSRVANEEFSVAHERVYLKAPARLAADPEMLLRLFRFVARHGLPLSWDAEQRIAHQLVYFEDWYAEHPLIWAAFREILSLPHADVALRAMHDAGVLRIILPEWVSVESLVVRDFYHRYTVDEHTLVAIQWVCELGRNPRPPHPRFAELRAEVERIDLALFALLCHDLGKAVSTAGHAARSVELAETAMQRLGTPESARHVVRFLIERHLELSSAFNTRDLTDPATALYLAHCVETVENLKKLVLLTYADISAVNPSAMTPWRVEQLWRVYVVAYRELTRELVAERIHEPQVPSPELAAFLEGFPVRYLHTHSAAEMEAHFALARAAAARGVISDLKRQNGYFSITVIAGDRPFLFATLAGVLAGFGMNILKAEAFTNRDGKILDTFVFEDPNHTLELNPSEVERLQHTLERAVLGKLDVRGLLANRPKPAPPSRSSHIAPTVAFDSAASASATLVEIVAEDRPGLLYDLARTLSGAGCNIEVVLIDTEAHKALDVFYVTSQGKKLTERQQHALREELIAVCAA